MARHLILRSWLLPWQEKRLLILPVFLFVALYTTEFLAKILGLGMNPRNPDADIYTILGYPLFEFIDAIIYTLMAAFSVAISLRFLNKHEINLSQILADLRLRIGALLVFALLIEFLFFVFAISWIRIRPFRSSWLLLGYVLFSLIWLLLVKIPFLLTLPTLVNEKGRFHHLLLRSWRYSRTSAGIILRSLPGLLFTLALLWFVAVVLDNVFIIWVTWPEIAIGFNGVLARYYERLVALPICWSYQALLYQHAVALADADDDDDDYDYDDADDKLLAKAKA